MTLDTVYSYLASPLEYFLVPMLRISIAWLLCILM